jgi:hypothetical protein
MKPQHNAFGWIGLTFLFTLLMSINFLSHSVSAQESFPLTATATPTGAPVLETEEPPIATATPTEIAEDNTFFPTITPTALIEETPPPPQEEERQAAPFQALQGESSALESIWPAFNISDTDTSSIDPSIAVDSAGKIHMVWAEAEEGTKWEIYYTYWDGVRLSQSVSA